MSEIRNRKEKKKLSSPASTVTETASTSKQADNVDEDTADTAELAEQRRQAQLRMQSLPGFMRNHFEKRKKQLLEKDPDFLRKATAGEMQGGKPALDDDEEILSTGCKIDLLVFFLVFLGFSYYMYKSFQVNTFAWIHQYLVQLLDPGLPPQPGQPIA
mmetsp:Transcript_5745/g.10944  ORF Transcript_5745/g.10944 Transcript_5745/m.10944 type:complete len:158 (+) Transcript_5745:31-504(+)